MTLPSRECLQYTQILDLFPLAVRNAIYAKSEHRAYKKGDFVYHDGDQGPFFMGCLISGRLRASVTSREGKEFLLSMIEKGEMFGEMSMFDQMSRPVDIIAESDCSVMILQPEDFLPHLLACPGAVMNLFKLNGHRMRAYVRRIELLALQTVKQKLGRHLIHLSRDFGRVVDDTIIIDVRQTQADIGLQLGVS
ncbi:MAG: Crp/Fnr family transcriptional regulator, partial [Alphaproteobacteria bacterium]